MPTPQTVTETLNVNEFLNKIHPLEEHQFWSLEID